MGDGVRTRSLENQLPDREAPRTLKPGGLFIGYVAYIECFHEISYSHLSLSARSKPSP